MYYNLKDFSIKARSGPAGKAPKGVLNRCEMELKIVSKLCTDSAEI